MNTGLVSALDAGRLVLSGTAAVATTLELVTGTSVVVLVVADTDVEVSWGPGDTELPDADVESDSSTRVLMTAAAVPAVNTPAIDRMAARRAFMSINRTD